MRLWKLDLLWISYLIKNQYFINVTKIKIYLFYIMKKGSIIEQLQQIKNLNGDYVMCSCGDMMCDCGNWTHCG